MWVDDVVVEGVGRPADALLQALASGIPAVASLSLGGAAALAAIVLLTALR